MFRYEHGVPTSLVGHKCTQFGIEPLQVRTPYRGSSPPFSLKCSNLQPHADLESPHQLQHR